MILKSNSQYLLLILEPIHLKKHLFSKKGVFCVFWLSVAFTAFASLNQNELPCPRGSFWLSKAKAGKACESQKKQNIETLKYCFFYFSVFWFFWLSEAFPAFALLFQKELPCPCKSYWWSKAKAGKASDSQKKQNIKTLKYSKIDFLKLRWIGS